jgi:hypothetical protein
MDENPYAKWYYRYVNVDLNWDTLGPFDTQEAAKLSQEEFVDWTDVCLSHVFQGDYEEPRKPFSSHLHPLHMYPLDYRKRF